MQSENDKPLPSAPLGRKSALGFFFSVLALYVLAGSTAQASSPVLGLAWSEIFAFLLPAAAAAAGSDYRVLPYLLLSRAPSPGQVSLGFFAGAAGFLVAGSLMGLLSRFFPYRWLEAFDLMRLFGGSPLHRAALALIASVLAPICEEAAFRGYLQTTLRRRLSPAAAIGSAAALFAVMHLDPVRFVALVLLGAMFGWLAYRSGSLWPAVAAHAANNGIGSLLAVSGAVEPGSEVPAVGPSFAALAFGLALLVPVLAAYRRATEPPPPIEGSFVKRDPSDPSARFRLSKLPAGLLVAAALGAILFAAVVLFGKWGGVIRR